MSRKIVSDNWIQAARTVKKTEARSIPCFSFPPGAFLLSCAKETDAPEVLQKGGETFYAAIENVDAKARQVIRKLLALFETIDTLAIDCQNALGINNGDYEDAILIESAARAGVDCIVTRNPAHFNVSSVQVYSPDEFIAVISHQEE